MSRRQKEQFQYGWDPESPSVLFTKSDLKFSKSRAYPMNKTHGIRHMDKKPMEYNEQRH